MGHKINECQFQDSDISLPFYYNITLCHRQTTVDKLTLTVNLITMADYERHHYDKELLAKTGNELSLFIYSDVPETNSCL